MEPEITEVDTFTVMGVQSHSPYETDDFGPIWEEFMAHHDEVQPYSTDGACYGVNYGEGDAMEYLAGMAVKGVTEVPEGVVLREVPGGRCAVFRCSVGTIHDTYEFIFHQWLSASGHEVDSSRAGFERYGPGTTTGESPVAIYVPLAR